jgi:RIO kinase 1
VEHDHPNALEFLRKDCANVHDFFKKKSVQVMYIRDTFEFITAPRLSLFSTATNDLSEDAVMDLYLEEYQQRVAEGKIIHDASADTVFQHAYIPRRLEEVLNVEREIDRVHSMGSDADGILYRSIAGVVVKGKQGEDWMRKVLGADVQQEARVNEDDFSDEDLSSSYSDSASDDSDSDGSENEFDEEEEEKLSPEEFKKARKVNFCIQICFITGIPG